MRSFTADLIRMLHQEICNSQESKIDHYLGKDHYLILLKICQLMLDLKNEAFLPHDDQ